MSFNGENRVIRVIDRERWLQVFYHDSTGQNYFANPEQAKYSLEDKKYSILANITNAYRVRGKFEFIIYWPSLQLYYRWRQTLNPLLDVETANVNEARGFELLHPIPDPSQAKFGGLVKSTIAEEDTDTGKEYVSTLLDGCPGIYRWFYSIGMYVKSIPHWYNTGKIPSNYGQTDIVSLWLLLPGSITCNMKKYFFTPNFFITIYLLSS